MNFIETLKNLCPRFTPFGFLLISYFIHVNTCNLIPCKRSDKCSCVIEDPKDHSHTTEFSLWPLSNNNGTPRFIDAQNWIYTVNLCSGFNIGSACKDVCGCQKSTNYSPYPLALGSGPLSFGPYDSNKNELFVTYKNATSLSGKSRSMVVTLTHGDSESITVLEHPSLHYNVFIASPKFVGHQKWEKNGLSVGSIIVIVFFVVLILYIIAGILFMKYRRGASGKELIPNLEFWSSLPGLIKEGCIFSGGKVKKICCKNSNYDEI